LFWRRLALRSPLKIDGKTALAALKILFLTCKLGKKLKKLLNALLIAKCGAYRQNFSVFGAFLAIFEQTRKSH